MTKWIGLLIALFGPGLGFAQSGLRYRAHLETLPESLGLSSPVTIDFTIDGIEPGACVYIPAHDQRLRDMLTLEALKAASPQENADRQDLGFEWVERGGLEMVSPALYRAPVGVSNPLHLKYLLRMGGWRDRPFAPRILSLWHPVVLRNCPKPGEETFASPWPRARFEVTTSVPSGWQIAAPGSFDAGHWSYEGSAFSAAFFKVGRMERRDIGGQTLISVSKSESFQPLLDFAAESMSRFKILTGRTQEQTILFVETDDFEPIRTPGLVTLNTPQQPGMRYLQQDLTHWNVWQMTLQIAQQWFGLGCRARTLDDLWVVQGLADMLIYTLLRDEPKYFDLFAKRSDGRPLLDLNYRQAQDIAAASMSLLHPQTSLLDEDGVSRVGSRDRPFIAYVRNTHILRYIQWKIGDRAFLEMLQELTQTCRTTSLDPKALAAVIESRQAGLGALALKYWQSNDWPDAALGGIEEKDGKAFVKVRFDSELLMPIDLWITRKNGEKRTVFVEPAAPLVEVPLTEDPDDIQKMEINPGRALFDKDRFNNKTGAPKIAFFPGGARGLEDDAYTVVWLPFVAQLPGDPFTINLAWQSLRYLGSGLMGLVRYQPKTDKTGFNLVYIEALPRYSLLLVTKMGQDDGRVEDGERRIDVALTRKPAWSLFPRLATSIKVKSKQLLGQPRNNHFTSSLILASRSETGSLCGHDEETEVESSVYVPSDDFHYVRSFARLTGWCEGASFGVKARGFWGASRTEGSAPRTAYFRAQNLDEAHVRLDKPNLRGSLRVTAFNLETSTPAALPLPESWFVLPRRSQFKVFFDGATLRDPDQKALVSGAGYSLPIGGDVAGKDTVTLFRFSLNGIFYRNIDGRVDTKPGLLFDFSGNL